MRQAEQRNILIVEDEVLIAMDFQHLLLAAGFKVIGPAGSAADALDLLRREEVDVAILDINLVGHTVFPVADVLDKMGIPFLIATGHTSLSIPGRYQDRPLLTKPCEPEQVIATVVGLLESAPNQPAESD